MSSVDVRVVRRVEPLVSVIVPVLNDAKALETLLTLISGDRCLEVIVADGGSRDDSAELARARDCTVISCVAGRGQQLAEGIARARAPWIWMLHADGVPSRAAVDHLVGRAGSRPGWGSFSVSLAPGTPLELVARSMNLRSRLTGICTGDQGIFVHRQLLDAVGGMPRQSLMEDIELSRRLRARQRPDCRAERIGTSPRRWRERGTVRTVLSMWRFRLRYWLGADAEHLAREYYRS